MWGSRLETDTYRKLLSSHYHYTDRSNLNRFLYQIFTRQFKFRFQPKRFGCFYLFFDTCEVSFDSSLTVPCSFSSYLYCVWSSYGDRKYANDTKTVHRLGYRSIDSDCLTLEWFTIAAWLGWLSEWIDVRWTLIIGGSLTAKGGGWFWMNNIYFA